METETQTQSQPVADGDAGANSPPNKTLRRACDCCRKRKVKCDGSEPCDPCKKASIRCAYLQPPKKKGPKGLRSARVLHALRRIDDSVTASPTSPLSPEQNGHFGGWAWTSQADHSLNAGTYNEQSIPPPSGLPYGPPTSIAQQPGYFQSVELPPLQNPPRQHPQAQQFTPSVYRQDSAQTWPHTEPLSAGTEHLPRIISPTQSDAYSRSPRIPSDHFQPYIQLFFSHMFPIMPVIDRNTYLNMQYASSAAVSPDVYCFLCSLCATTSVQLDESIATPPPLRPGRRNEDVFAEECLRERRNHDYISSTSTLSVMTSFFLFCYYGNHERHDKAWYFLQESITFAENLNLEDEAAYNKLEAAEVQWRRRLYWLLFITERAYAVQRRKRTRLTPSVELPAVFDSEDPTLLNGFVLLAKLFSAIDDDFVSAWRGTRRQSLCNEAWLAKTQKSLDEYELPMDNITETQLLDISITREWLHVLAWQMGVSNGLIWGQGEGGMRLDYPIELARKVVGITSGANKAALDSHGIGMEQKLSDIAGCLADVLKCTAGDTSPTFYEGKQYLSILLQQLSSIRGKESRYLRPLMEKMEGLMGYENLTPQTSLPPPSMLSQQQHTNGGSSQQLAPMLNGYGERGPSVSQGSMEMLRSLSMSGSLGMPALQADMWTRRPSERFGGEEELVSWLLSGPGQQ